MIIYGIFNNINGKVYVGQTKQMLAQRIYQHRFKKNLPIGHALRKYGEESFTIFILDCAKAQDELDEKEQYWIAHLGCKAPVGYNLADGGGGSLNPIPEIREKNSLWHKGRKVSDETKNKLSLIRKGVKKSEEHKKKIALAHKGMTYSEETKQKVAASQRGRIHSAEHKAKVIAAIKNRPPYSEETRNKMRVSMKVYWSENRDKMMSINALVQKKLAKDKAD